MKTRMSNILTKIYNRYFIFYFKLKQIFLGFDNATKLLYTIDKRAVIPILRTYGAKIGENCDIEVPLIFHNCTSFQNLIIGNNCHIGKDVFLDLRAPIILEDNVTISMRTTIITHIDVGHSPLKEKELPSTQGRVIFKKGAYVGANATILHDVTIGECAVVAAGAVVNKDVPSYTVVGGVPAKALKTLHQHKNR